MGGTCTNEMLNLTRLPCDVNLNSVTSTYRKMAEDRKRLDVLKFRIQELDRYLKNRAIRVLKPI